MKTVMILVAFGTALVVACLLTTTFCNSKNEITYSDAFCFSQAAPADAATWMAKVRHDNCISGEPEDQSNREGMLESA